MNPSDFILICALCLWLGWSLNTFWRKRSASLPPPVSHEPRVVVNVPPDWKPLSTLPPTQIEGARATLFWTVYSKAIDAFTSDGDAYLTQDEESEAYNSASKAVEAVFGPLP